MFMFEQVFMTTRLSDLGAITGGNAQIMCQIFKILTKSKKKGPKPDPELKPLALEFQSDCLLLPKEAQIINLHF